MNFRIFGRRAALLTTVVSLAALAGCGVEQEDDNVDSVESPSVAGRFQSAEEGYAEDLALTAEARGWTLEEAAAHREGTDAVGRVAERIALERPELFVGSMVGPEPLEPPVLFIKGPADDYVKSLIAQEEIYIRIVDNQPFTFWELEERQHAVHRRFTSAGLTAMTAFRIEHEGRIEAVVVPGPRAPTLEDIQALVPKSLRSEVVVELGGESLFQDEAGAFGGMWAQDDGVQECTTGWAVTRNSDDRDGVTTAGHCNGINQVLNPSLGVQNVQHAIQHMGQWGDVELKFETNVNFQEDDFYASPTSIRDVASVEAVANFSVGESICVFGRSTGSRDCSADVDAVSISCGNLQRLVRMDDDVSTGGDSGGGWSWNTRAYGGHFGKCGGLSSFTKADHFDEAIGATVKF